MLMLHPEHDLLDDNDAKWHTRAQQLLSMKVFAATLMAHSDSDFDVSFPATIAMEDGINRTYDDSRELQEQWRMYIPPAATWMLIAGSKILELCL